jgi:hypothetical protein
MTILIPNNASVNVIKINSIMLVENNLNLVNHALANDNDVETPNIVINVVTALEPLSPFNLAPFNLAPFNLSPFNLAPFNLAPFNLAP